MIPSTLCMLVSVVSSLAAVNGAVIQRDGTFTYLTPQPTLQAGTTTTASSSSPSSSPQSSSTMTSSSTSSSTTSISTPSTTLTSASSTISVTVPSTSSTTTSSAVSLTFIPTSTSSTTPTKPPSTTSSPSTTPTVTTTTQTTMSSTIPIVSPTVPTTTPLSSTVTTATATATSTPAPGSANCNGIQNWQSAFAYTAGDQVIFNGQLFTAKQWTYNNAPPTHPDQWTAVGTCAQPINNQVNCNGIAAWESNIAYTAGNRVTFHGHLWSAVQWTQSNAPGDASGSWKDLGACA